MDWHMDKNDGLADDRKLLQRLKESDRKAFTAIYMRYHVILYNYAMYYVKSRADVEDIVQSVFIKLWTAREAIFVTTSLRSYLFMMTKHTVLNYIRNHNRALQHNYRLVQQQPDCDDDLYTYAERHHMAEALRLAIKCLPPRQQAVASMRCEGYSNREIALKLNLSVNTVNTHYRACLKTLKIFVPGFVKFLFITVFFNL